MQKRATIALADGTDATLTTAPMTQLPTLKIFLSSPGDVAEERALAEIVFRRLADEVADAVRLEVVIWEHEPLFGHTGFQEQIQRPSQCDLVVSVLWSRLGTRLPSDFAPAAGELPPTGTEFEINDALSAYSARGRPNLLIYRKMPGPQIGLGSPDFQERSEQYQRLDEFVRRTFHDAQGAVRVAYHTFADSHDFERRLSEHVGRWLDREIHRPGPEGTHRPLWRGKSPFRGLQSFEAEHQNIFFGRSEAQGHLLRRIRDTETADAGTRLLLVQGMSGAGKTSLFRAGLLPMLELRPIEGIARWLSVFVRPSESDPALRESGALGVLASRLCERVPALARLGNTPAKLAEALRTRPAEAATRIDSCLAADADRDGLEPERVRLIVYVDQLEEVFALTDSGEGERAFLAAVAALSHAARIWVAATLRSDFVHRLETHAELMDCLSHNSPYTLLPPRPDELAEMIREPAKAAGLIWEQRDGVSLDQELLRDAVGNPEALPLLEYTLAELYEKRDGRLLRWADYGGGLKDALLSAADQVVQGDEDAALREVMRELVSVGEDGVATRRYASLRRFPAQSPARGLLERLVERRLCVTFDQGRGDGPVACLAHEALIRSWPRAQEWLQQELSLLRMRDEVARDAQLWAYHERAPDWLGVAPEKLAAIRRIERAHLMPAGPAADYALQSRRRGRRNRRLRRAALAGSCTLALLAGVAWWLALGQRDVARTEAATADRTTQFMVSLFHIADPGENRGASVTVKEVLDKGAHEIRESAGDTLAREPRVRAELLTAMGEAYSGLGLYEPAEQVLRGALADAGNASVPAESRIKTLRAAGEAQYLAGQYDAAESTLRQAVQLARRALPPSSELRSRTLDDYADVLVQSEKFGEAEAACQEALRSDRQRGADGAPVLSRTLDSLGKAYEAAGQLREAEAPLREALSLRERFYGLQHALTAASLEELATLLYQSGRYAEAIALHERALPILRQVYGAEHPEVATALNNTGRADLMVGRIDAAEPLLRQALALTEKFQDPEHDFLVSPLNSLAMIEAYRGNPDAARRDIERAAHIARLPDHGELLDQVLLNQADIELAAGHTAQAGTLLNEARGLLEKAHPNNAENAWRYAVFDAAQASLLAAQGDSGAAAQLLGRAQPLLVQRFGEAGFYPQTLKRRDQAVARAAH